jgi:hypothetical protein
VTGLFTEIIAIVSDIVLGHSIVNRKAVYILDMIGLRRLIIL